MWPIQSTYYFVPKKQLPAVFATNPVFGSMLNITSPRYISRTIYGPASTGWWDQNVPKISFFLWCVLVAGGVHLATQNTAEEVVKAA